MTSVFSYSATVADAKAPEPLPAARYRMIVRNVSTDKPTKDGKPMAAIQYFISADQYPPDYTDGNPDGTLLTNYFVFDDTPAGVYRARKLCELHNVEPEGNAIDFSRFIGAEVVGVTKIETYNGERRATIDKIEAA